jgi:hypothetical protein
MDYTNTINVWAPRWHDRTAVVANWKIVNGLNKIVIDHHSFHAPFYMTSTQLWKYPIEEKPTKSGRLAKYRIVPLNDLEHSTENYHIKQTVKEIF